MVGIPSVELDPQLSVKSSSSGSRCRSVLIGSADAGRDPESEKNKSSNRPRIPRKPVATNVVQQTAASTATLAEGTACTPARPLSNCCSYCRRALKHRNTGSRRSKQMQNQQERQHQLQVQPFPVAARPEEAQLGSGASEHSSVTEYPLTGRWGRILSPCWPLKFKSLALECI